MRCRYDNRETLKIEDEYDVQDLLHALLLIYFDDVRAEEWTPSYAGKSARMDFFCQAIVDGIPLRGCIGTELAIMNQDKSIYLGEPLVEVAKGETA